MIADIYRKSYTTNLHFFMTISIPKMQKEESLPNKM